MEKDTKTNIIRGVLVALIGSIRTIVIPYLLFTMLFAPDGMLQLMIVNMIGGMFGGGGGGPELSGPLFGTTGDITAIKMWIISLGSLVLALKIAKGFSPKRSGSARREIFRLLQIVMRWPVLMAYIMTGTTVFFLSFFGMGLITFDLTPLFLFAMGFVVFRMIPIVVSLVEAIIMGRKRG